MRAVLVLVTLLLPLSVFAQPLGPNWRGLLEPHQSLASGPGINRATTGSQFGSLPISGNGSANGNSNVSPDAHGTGVGMDEDEKPAQLLVPSGE